MGRSMRASQHFLKPMPTIVKQQKVNNYQRHGKAATIAKLYTSSNWQKLRNSYLIYHPLCEVCQTNGITKEAQEVHHIKPISTGKDELEMRELTFNPCNLMAVCSDCHHRLHTQLNRQKQPIEN